MKLISNTSVAFGAAIQAAVLERKNDVPRIFLKSVTPLSLGLQTFDSEIQTIIKRNTPYPIEVCRFGKSKAQVKGGVSYTLPIYEGEPERPELTTFLGKLTFKKEDDGNAISLVFDNN